MKKFFTLLLASALATSLMTPAALAHGGRHHSGGCRSAAPLCSFTDADEDGHCDACGQSCWAGHACRFVDEDGNGVCDLHHSSLSLPWGRHSHSCH